MGLSYEFRRSTQLDRGATYLSVKDIDRSQPRFVIDVMLNDNVVIVEKASVEQVDVGSTMTLY